MNTLNMFDFTHFRQAVIDQLQQDITDLFAELYLPSPLLEACQYAVTSGGKCVRPLLVASSFASLQPRSFIFTSLLSEPPNQDSSKSRLESTIQLSSLTRRAMLAVELLHAYSLVHDDLPCMDDDDLRRGRPTCHIAFDEATALLAGDVLQTLAFEVLTTDWAFLTHNHSAQDTHATDQLKQLPSQQSPHLQLQMISVFAPRARRMVAGQMLDLNGEGKQLSQNELESIHKDKTGALIEAAVMMGAISAGSTSAQLTAVEQFAKRIGLAFQVQDDILDVTASTEDLGKPAGSDEKLDKSTYVKLMGVEAARQYAKDLFDESKMILHEHIGTQTPLEALADWLWQRQY